MVERSLKRFQSSFELTGYITGTVKGLKEQIEAFQSSFELTGYITNAQAIKRQSVLGFKALSSLRVV